MSAPMGMQPTGSPGFLQNQPTGFQPQATGFQPQATGFQPQQTGSFMQPQPTGFMAPQATGMSFQSQQQQQGYNQVPQRFSPAPPHQQQQPPVQFNPLPPGQTSAAPPASSTTAQFQPSNIFSSMKDGTFAKGSTSLGPQDPTKYDALRPQMTGMCESASVSLPISSLTSSISPSPPRSSTSSDWLPSAADADSDDRLPRSTAAANVRSSYGYAPTAVRPAKRLHASTGESSFVAEPEWKLTRSFLSVLSSSILFSLFSRLSYTMITLASCKESTRFVLT